MSASVPAAPGSWVELQIELPAEAADLVAAALVDITAGVEIRDQDTLLKAPPGRAIAVTLVEPARVDEVLAELEGALGLARGAGTPVDPVTIRRRDAHEDEWRDVWKQFFRATRIGRRFIVRPSWDPQPIAEADQVIELDPGRAFGTGAHPTTRLVIALCEDLRDAGFSARRFVDLGCGSGILSIAAARLWPAADGTAIDNDPEATACTDENLARNQVTTVATRTGTIDDVDGTVDLILANIQADVLIPIADRLRAHLGGGGRAVLSGILIEQADTVVRAYEAVGLVCADRRDDGEWTGLVVKA